MARKDQYYNKSKQEGYRARSAYKLKQLDDAENIIHEGDTVVDLGAAPGGWLQVASERVGKKGTVIGVDFQRIKDLDGIETIRGDITDDETKEAIGELAGEGVDVVLSDMAPNMTGEYSLDQARSVYLAQQAFETAKDVLRSGGNFVVKVFQGRDLQEFRDSLKSEFKYVRTTSPDASRDESSEVYVIGKGFLTAPISKGDVLEVTVENVGSEGDGIAKVEGFTVFVPGVEAGETVEVRIDDVKPRFAFAQVVE